SSSVMYFIVPGMVFLLVRYVKLQIKSPIWYSDCMALEIRQIRHVGLFTPHLKEHARFYSDVWGLDPVSETAHAVYRRGSSPQQVTLSLHQSSRRGLHHIAYALSDQEAVQRSALVLKDYGVRIVEGPHRLEQPGGGFGLQFIDPDGRCIEL